jgi:ribose transport system substrate-binding protein
VVVLMMAAMLAVTASGVGQTTSPVSKAKDDQVNIAVFSVLQNTYAIAQQKGINEAAKRAGNVKVTVFSAGFDPQKQFTQCEDAITSKKFNAFILTPVNGPTVVPCVRDAVKAGIKVAVHGTPLGNDFTTPKPPVPGMAGNVLVPAGPDGVSDAKLIVAACKKTDPCRVAYIFGARAVGWDLARFNALKGYLKRFKNIQIVAQGEGAFAPDTALKAATDLLTAHPDLNVLASCCDQGALGWERAVANADAKGKVIIGGGAGCTSIQRIKAGKWFGTTVLLPKSGAERAADIVIRSVRGQPVGARGVNEATLSPAGAIITKKNAGRLRCEWSG